ncbi:MAG: ABC transporter permease subunit [Tepidisphaeraceae bacterium]
MASVTGAIRRVWPFGAIFGLELRQLARRPQTYATRCIYLGLLLLFLSFAWMAMNGGSEVGGGIVQAAQRRAETGRAFFIVFGIFSILAMQLAGPVLTSNALSADRLRRTLDVLLMTPLSAWQIVAGKLMSRLWTAMMLLGLSLPVLAIVRLLGGVELSQAIGTLALCVATALGSASIGLLFSGMLRRSWATVTLAYFTQFTGYFLLPTLLSVLQSATHMSPQTTLPVYAALNPLVTQIGITAGQGGFPVDWWPAIAVQLGLALMLSVLTAAMLRRSTRAAVIDRDADPTPPPLPTPLPPSLPTHQAIAARDEAAIDVSPATPPPLPAMPNPAPMPAKRRSRDVGDAPVLWHELRRPLMTRPVHRFVGVLLTGGLLLLSYIAFVAVNGLQRAELQKAYAVVMQTLLLMTALVISATSIAGEKESDTWTTLVSTPLSARAIVYGKFLGILRRLMWPWLLVIAHFAAFTVAGVISVTSFGIIFWTTLTFTPIWVATGLYLSLRCKRPTTAVVLNLLLPVLAFAGVPMVLSILQSYFFPDAPATWHEVTAYYLPYYFTNTGITPPGGNTYSFLKTFAPPMTFTRISLSYLPLIALGAGVVQLLVTFATLHTTHRRFDRIVGRAETREKGYSRSSVPAVTPS